MKSFTFTQSGFSLVETLVAITILLIVVVGPMTIAANATQGTNFSSEQVIAFFLAQEGAELAQKNRDDVLLPFFDTPGLPDEGWSSIGFPSCSVSNGGCGMWIEDNAQGVVAHYGFCSTDPENCRVFKNSDPDSRQQYVQADPSTVSARGLVPTIYYRTITFDQPTGDEVRIVSRVTWTTGNQRQEQSAEVVTYLYNVYGR